MKKHLIVLAALTFFPVFSPSHASTHRGGGNDCGSGLLNLGDGSSGAGCGGRHVGGSESCGSGMFALGESGGGGNCLATSGEGGSGCGSGSPLGFGEGGSGCGHGGRSGVR